MKKINNEIPSEYMIQALKESEEDRKAGRCISFSSGDEALKFLRSLRNNKRTREKK